jgi:hypothetical protein
MLNLKVGPRKNFGLLLVIQKPAMPHVDYVSKRTSADNAIKL